jgi:hypothetical protein
MTKYKLIGLYELITGIFGFILIFMNVGWIREHKDNFNTFIIGIALYGLSILAGYTLWKGIKNAAKYSIVLQVLQSFGFIYKGYQYLFTGGAFLAVIIKSNGVTMHSQITPIDYLIAHVSTSQPFEVKLFIVPIVFLIILLLNKSEYTHS